MSRGNPYGTDSFPAHERLTRCLLALSHGSILAESMGWPGHDVAADFQEVAKRDRYLKRLQTVPWAAQLVSEQTRQFYAYRDIPERFLAHQFGAFRAASEEHLPLTLINDWDVEAAALAQYAVVLLPNAAALSAAQVAALRQYVQDGGGLVATGETSLCDELGRPRKDFALADLFGVSYRGRPKALQQRPKLDENFAIALDDNYWKQRSGVATLTWKDHPLLDDRKLRELVPRESVIFRGPLVAVSEPAQTADVAIRLKPEGAEPTLPAAVLQRVGQGPRCLLRGRSGCGSVELRLSVPAPAAGARPALGGSVAASARGDRADVRASHLFSTERPGWPAADRSPVQRREHDGEPRPTRRRGAAARRSRAGSRH